MPDDESILLRQFLDSRDIACPQCEYNVRDLQGDICPECGEQLLLRLQLAEPRQAAPIFGLVGLSCGLGFNFLLLLYFLIETFVVRMGPRGSEMWRFFFVLFVGLLIFVAAVLAWLRIWRRIRTLSPRIRWWLASMGWVLSIIDLVIFTATIR